MPTLRLLSPAPGNPSHSGEMFACAFTPDSAYILSGGWDGHVRLWEGGTGAQVSALRASHKPISACTVSPDGTQWLTGCLDGFLTHWDAATQHTVSRFVAHSRPISAIAFGADQRFVVTASWDRNLILWEFGEERQSRALVGHGDIVAGCRFTADGKRVLSWSHDGTLALWDVSRAQRLSKFTSHRDRITAGAVAPLGSWAASGSRDRKLKLWNLQSQQEVASHTLHAEVRACFFMLDGESLLAIDAHGRLSVHEVPSLTERAELLTRLPVQCAALAPSGSQIALGCENGALRLVAVDGFDNIPLVVTATQTSRRTATTLQRLFGHSRLVHAYQCTCPVCRQAFELPVSDSGQSLPCPNCRRHLRLSDVVLAAQEI